MKSATLALLMLAAQAQTQAQTGCLPTDWQHPAILQGCPSLYKREDSEVQFPNGYHEYVVQAGNGQCAPKSSCNPVEYALGLSGTLECWPQFNAPVRGWGIWRRTVSNSKIGNGVVGQCSERTENESITVPLFGPICQMGIQDTVEVDTQCEQAGGPTVTINGGLWPNLDPWERWPGDPCFTFFLMGVPCPFNY